MKVIQQGSNAQTMATHVFQIIFLGITGFRFPIAHFPVTEATASEIHCMIHRAVHCLSTWEFDVKYINMDGASANRAFMHLNLPSPRQSMVGFSEGNSNSSIHFIMYFSHCVKKIRNNIMKSCWGSTKLLTLAYGNIVVWKVWEQAYNWDSTNPAQIHRKLTREHIYPNGPQKMRNHLAEEVLDTAYQSALGSNGCKVGGDIQLVEQTAKFIANFKDPRPLTQKDDKRIIANREVST